MSNNASWLSLVSMSDTYQRRARFLPAFLSILVLVPPAVAFGESLGKFYELLSGGLGVGVVLAIGLSHLASAAGNRFQRKLWPRWPYDSPTNLMVHPNDRTQSQQQKTIWYASIKRLTDLDIAATQETNDDSELDAVVNDALTSVRYRLRNSEHADRLRAHNIDYGFARNFGGLRLFWMPSAVLGCVVCWLGYVYFNKPILWGVISTAILILSVYVNIIVPQYVRDKARNYAESLLGAMMELDRSTSTTNTSKSGIAKGVP